MDRRALERTGLGRYTVHNRTITSKRAEPLEFTVTATGDKIRDNAGGNRMTNLSVTFAVTFPR